MSDSDVDFYKILDISPTASPEEIKAAYRHLALKLHPDRNPGNPHSEAAFQEMQAAYRVLSNPEKRSGYDRSLKARLTEEEENKVHYSSSEYSPPQPVPQVRTASDSPSYDVHAKAKISVGMAWTGGQVEVMARIASPCPVCRGVSPQCPSCLGTGQVFTGRTFTVRVPPGVKPGQVLSLPGQGHSGPRHPQPGNLLLEIVVQLPRGWRMVNGELEYRIRLRRQDHDHLISLISLDGKVGKVAVTGNVMDKMRIRLKGSGWMDNRGVRGDAWLVVALR